MPNPTVTIIVPVYNAESYLERCIISLLNQDYFNIKIILINDGSTDSSKIICEKFEELYPKKICVINQQNQGASIARKIGIEAADGEYLMFADSDDFVSPSYVSALLHALVKSKAEIAICPVKRIEIGQSPEFSETFTYKTINNEEIFRRFFKYEFWGFVCGIYKRNLFQDLIFPTATVNEDYFIKAQIFVNQPYVGYVTEALYCYEQHPDSLSKQPLSLRALGEFDNANATWEFITKNAPVYTKQALAITSEAACKWLTSLNKQEILPSEISKYKTKIRDFIRNNFKDIALNPHLLWKIKIVLAKAYFLAK